MPRTFAYLRVSTSGQTTDNQLQKIKAAGFKVEPGRMVTETVSGNVATSQRRGFTRLLDRLEPGDVLVVTKLDRLGRNVMDVGSTVTKLAELGVRVHCLALGGVDLTSSTGKLTMNVLNAVAEFERDLLVERTQAGLSRAKAAGKTLGRPPSLTDDQRRAVEQRLEDGATVSALARAFKTSRNTIMRVRDANARALTGTVNLIGLRRGKAGETGWAHGRLCPSGSIWDSGEMIAAEVEEVVDPLVGGEETLGLARRLEPLHLSLAPAGRLVGILRSVV
jgi:putative DNA-invertase from lambdoid prophage Rac